MGSAHDPNDEWNVEQKNSLQISAAFHGFHHRDFVGVFEVGADGNANTDAGYAHAERLDEFREIHGRGFAFRVGVGCDDDFFDRAALEAFDQTFQMQLIGADASHGASAPPRT